MTGRGRVRPWTAASKTPRGDRRERGRIVTGEKSQVESGNGNGDGVLGQFLIFKFCNFFRDISVRGPAHKDERERERERERGRIVESMPSGRGFAILRGRREPA